MKTLITLLLLAPLSIIAQTKSVPTHTKVVPVKKVEVLKKQPVSIVKINPIKEGRALPIHTDPVFPGGMIALDDYVKTNFKISRKDRKKQVEGQIQVKFTIAADGTVKDVKVLNGGMSEKLNKQALKVISGLPNWTAGTINGEAVDVLYAYTIKVGR